MGSVFSKGILNPQKKLPLTFLIVLGTVRKLDVVWPIVVVYSFV
jgi:hypothetical protein